VCALVAIFSASGDGREGREDKKKQTNKPKQNKKKPPKSKKPPTKSFQSGRGIPSWMLQVSSNSEAWH